MDKLKNKNLKEIDKELRLKFPGKPMKHWFKHYISGVVYQNQSITSIADALNISRNTIYKYIDDDIKDYIEELKEKQFSHYQQITFNLIEKSLKVIEDLVENGADSDATRLRAAEHILKKFKIIEDNQKIEHSGTVSLPVINIIGTKNE